MTASSGNDRRRLRVLVLGAGGLIGGAVCEALLTCGHVPVRGIRQRPLDQPAGADSVYVDFADDPATTDWATKLQDVDAVVNAVGIFAEHGEQTFGRIHVEAPRSLAAACRAAGITRMVHISALGADEHAQSPFHRSKRAGDDAVRAEVPTAAVVQPSLVFAPDGASSRMLLSLALLPLVVLPDRGRQMIQPIHLADLAALVVRLLEEPAPPSRIAAVGPQALRLADYLAELRQALGRGRPWCIGVPSSALIRLGTLAGGRWVDPDALAMLDRGNTADATEITRLLGHLPRPPGRFIAPAAAADLRSALAWRSGALLARLAIAAVWLMTGIVSLGLYPKAQSLALLAQVGLHGDLAQWALYGAAVLDLAFGVATLALRRRRALYLLQIATILGYTLIISVALPAFWLHPFGPILKNLPMLVLLGVLYATERR
jgi:uncharacterized protein YbjT (DUF2867 family)